MGVEGLVSIKSCSYIACCNLEQNKLYMGYVERIVVSGFPQALVRPNVETARTHGQFDSNGALTNGGQEFPEI
jgi:hypothetical protein